MTVLKRLGLAFALLIALIGRPLLAQTAPTPPSGVPTRRPQPCWKQAGISSSAMPQIREIRQTLHTQVESVCSDSSLTSQQKQQHVQQLREGAYQQVDALVGSQQREALVSCQEQRAGSGTHHGGPCGGMAAHPAQKPAPQQP